MSKSVRVEAVKISSCVFLFVACMCACACLETILAVDQNLMDLLSRGFFAFFFLHLISTQNSDCIGFNNPMIRSQIDIVFSFAPNKQFY